MKPNFLISVILFFFQGLFLYSYCQESQVDSLQSLLYHTEAPEEKIEFLDQIHTSIERTDRTKALAISKEMLRIAELGVPTKIPYCLNIVGVSYRALELQDSALVYFQRGLEKAIELNDSAYIGKTNFNIGATWMDLGSYDKALWYMRTGADMDLQRGDQSRAAANYTSIGAVYAQLDKLDTAEIMIMKGLSAAEASGSKIRLAESYQAIAFVNELKKNFDLAKEYYDKQIQLTEELEHYSFTARGYRNLANIYRIEGKYGDAIMYSNHALKLSKLIGEASLVRDSYDDLRLIASEQGNYKEAYNYLNEMIMWKDTLDQREGRQRAKELEAKYQTAEAKKENEILSQKNQITTLENEKSKEQLANSRIVAWSSIGGVLLLVGLAFSLYNRNKLKAKANAELQNANDIINEKNEDITASLEYASKIQEALLPTKENTSLFDDSLFMLKPKDIVSGDFFWYAEQDGKKIFTAVDCTGHGVPGAFMSMIGNSFLHEIINERGTTKPSDILDQLRAKVVLALSQRDARKDGMDMALCTLDENTMTLEYAGANNPLYLIQDGEMKEYRPDKQPVGFMPERDGPFTNHQIKVNKGDKAYVFSDGYADQFGGPKGKKFKYKQLRELLMSIHDKPMSEQKDILMQRFDDWKGDLEQIDDVCLVGVCV